jgi:cytochrome c-type protein NapB
MHGPDPKRLKMIVMASALMAAGVFVVGETLRAERDAVLAAAAGPAQAPSIPTETGVFRRAQKALAYQNAEVKDGSRTLAVFYARRAYSGAPPVIPHQDFDAKGMGGKACLSCHSDGAFVPFLKAYAPVVPHPEMTNCKSCHVFDDKVAAWQGSSFAPLAPPTIGGSAMPGSPPPIPHTLDMRNNCLSCHGGPSAVNEIRTSHPERVNCRQCHAGVAEGTASLPFGERIRAEGWEP